MHWALGWRKRDGAHWWDQVFEKPWLRLYRSDQKLLVARQATLRSVWLCFRYVIWPLCLTCWLWEFVNFRRRPKEMVQDKSHEWKSRQAHRRANQESSGANLSWAQALSWQRPDSLRLYFPQNTRGRIRREWPDSCQTWWHVQLPNQNRWTKMERS